MPIERAQDDTPGQLSETDILDCFAATPIEGQRNYLVAVGRAIEAKAQRLFESRTELVGYQWAGCMLRLEETHAGHRAEGAPLYRIREPQA